MRFAFIFDPLDGLKAYKDTSLAIMREAARRGHELHVALQHDLLLRHDRVQLRAQSFAFTEGAQWHQTGATVESAPAEFDAVLMRKDPPFDNEYLYSTYLLELAVNQGARVLNNPNSIRSWNEKLSIARFPQFAPEFLVTSNSDLIRAFLAGQGDIVVQTLGGMRGHEVRRPHAEDHTLGVILANMTRVGRRTIMAQRYLPEIREGDKRILVINGEPLPYALARIPKKGETRGN